jgi:hypothetical protein
VLAEELQTVRAVLGADDLMDGIAGLRWVRHGRISTKGMRARPHRAGRSPDRRRSDRSSPLPATWRDAMRRIRSDQPWGVLLPAFAASHLA